MNNLIVSLGVAIILVSQIQSSAQEINTQRHKYVVAPKSPSVYIVQETTVSKGEELAGRVSFRLYNNLKWPIRLNVSTPGDGEGDVQLDYELLGNKDEVSGGYGCHVCTITLLGSGKSLSFSLPKSEVAQNLRLRVEYSNYWESVSDVGTEKEPFHYVLLTFTGK